MTNAQRRRQAKAAAKAARLGVDRLQREWMRQMANYQPLSRRARRHNPEAVRQLREHNAQVDAAATLADVTQSERANAETLAKAVNGGA